MPSIRLTKLTVGYLPVVEHFELQAQYLDSLPRLRDVLLRQVPFQMESDVDALLDTVHVHTVDVFGKCNDRAVAARKAISHKRRKTAHPKPVPPICETSTHTNLSRKAPTPSSTRTPDQWPLPLSSGARNAPGSLNASTMLSSCWQEGGTWDSTSSAIESLTDRSSLPGTMSNISDSGPPLLQHATNELDENFPCLNSIVMPSTAQSEAHLSLSQLNTAGLQTRFTPGTCSHGGDEQFLWPEKGDIYDAAYDFNSVFPPDPSQVSC